jgi:hypothetical protein
MLKDLKFPLLYVAEVLLFLPLLAGFVGIISFLAAAPLSTLDLRGKSLPADWEAAVPNHGKFLPGYLIANHPIMFAFTIVLLLGSVAVLYRVQRAQALQLKEAHVASANSHKIARGVVFAVWAAITFVLVMRVLVGVSPA